MALSATNLSAAQREQVLSYIATQTPLATLTAEQVKACTIDERRLLVKAGLISEEQLETGTEVILNEEKKESILNNEILTAQEKDIILSKFGVTNANIKEASSWKILGARIKESMLAFATNPATWVIAGIAVAHTLVEAFNDSTQEIEERLEETRNTIQETDSEISSITQKIEANTQKLEEMRAAGMDESALQTYVLENEELERQKQLLIDINEESKKKIAPDVAKLVNNEGKQTTFGRAFDKLKSGDIGGYLGETAIGHLFSGEYFKDGGKEKLANDIRGLQNPLHNFIVPVTDPDEDIIARTNSALDKYKKYKEELENLNEEDFKSKEAFWNKQQELNGKIGEVSSTIGTNISTLIGYREKLAKSDGANTYYADEIKKIDDIIKGYYSANPESAFDYVFSQESFADVKKKLDDFSKSGLGELRTGIQDLIPVNGELYNKLVDFGLITKDNANWVDELAIKFDFLSHSTNGVDENVDKMTVQLEDLKNASDGISKISDAFNSLSEDGFIPVEKIAEIKEAVGSSVKNWEDYEKILLTAKSGSAELNNALADLTYATLEAQFASVGLENATEEQIAAVLRENDVANADALAIEYLARAKAQASIDGANFADIESLNIKHLIDEGVRAGLTEAQMYNLILSHIQFNNTNLNSEQKVAALMEIATAADIAKAEIDKVFGASSTSDWNKKQSWMADNDVTAIEDAQGRTGKTKDGKTYNYKDYMYNGVRYDTVDDVNAAITRDKIKSQYSDQKFDFSTVNYTPKSSSKKDTSADDAKKKAEEAEKARIEAFKEGLEARKDILDRYKEHIDTLDFGLDILSEEDYSGQFDVLTLKLDQATEYGKALKAEFEDAASTIPRTAEEVEALGSHLDSLSSDIRTNIEDIREMTVALEKAKIGMISGRAQGYIDEMSSEIDSLERRIEILRADNKNDYKYTNKILNMEMLLPNQSTINEKVREKSKEDREIIKMEQETQDTLDGILRTQIEKNEKLRADERAKLLVNMEELKANTQKKINEVQASYEYSLQQNEENTQESCDAIASMIDSTDVQFPDPYIDFSKAEKQFDDFGKVVDRLDKKALSLAKSLGLISEYSGIPTPKPMPGTSGSGDLGGMPFDSLLDAKNGIDGTSKTLGGSFDEKLKDFETKIDEWLDQHGGDGYPFEEKYNISSYYGYRTHPIYGYRKFHSGVDFNAPFGAKILSVSSGTVELSSWNGGYGNCIIVRDGSGNKWLYGHMAEQSVLGVGDKVGKGQVIGYVGSTGLSTGPHLHLERRTSDNSPVDPLPHLPYYAKGTLKGNLLAKKLGIAGENYKSEILVDKFTGKMEFIDTPTIIDTTKTDVIGEKATANIPKFADGTYRFGYISAKYETGGWNPGLVSTGEGDYGGISYGLPQFSTTTGSANNFVNWLKEVNSEIGELFTGLYAGTEDFGNAWKKAYEIYGDTFGSLQQEYAYNEIVAPVIEAVQKEYGVDLTRSPALLEMAYSTANQYGDSYPFSDINKNMTDAEIVSAVYDYKAMNVDRDFRGSSQDARNAIKTNRIPNERKDVEALLGKTWEDVGGIPVAEKEIVPEIKKILGITNPYDAKYDEADKTYKRKVLEANNKSSMDESYTDLEHAKDLYKAAKEKSDSVLEDGVQAYNDVLWEYFNYMDNGGNDLEVIQAFEDSLKDLKDAVVETEKTMVELRDTAFWVVEDSLSDIDDYISEHDDKGDWGRIGDTKADAIRRKKEILSQYRRDDILSEKDFIKLMKELDNAEVEAEFEHSSNWIAERNTYNDWALFDDSEVDAWERVVKWLNEEYPEDISKIKEAEQNLFEARKNEFSKATEFGNSYLESQKTLLQSHFNIENSIAEARHEINKELETSKTMYEWLDEDSRQLLFNQEDYNELSRELLEIEGEAERLQKQYQEDLDGATLETIESITANYERQYETLMKSYEIAKADLEVAKKKQKLNNVLNERNVRMFVNGSWQWVANTEDVINAKSELADAEYAKQVEEAGLTQKQSIDALSKQQDELALVVKEFEGGVISLGDAVALAADAIGDIPQAMEDMLKSADVDTKSYTSGSSSKSYGDVWYDSNINYMDRIRNASSEAEVIENNTSRNAKVYGEGMDKDLVMTNAEAIKEWKKHHWSWDEEYATGSKNTRSGLALMGEDGEEFYISSWGRLTPITQPTIGNISGGGIVFNTEQMKNLRTMWDMSNLNLNADRSYISRHSQETSQTYDNRIIINGMTVDNGSADGQALISALRRYVGNH